MAEKTAIFAGGCFWCMVEPFETLPGIIALSEIGLLIVIRFVGCFVFLKKEMKRIGEGR
jgi:hypothetical protein